jgi:hypothetical protein
MGLLGKTVFTVQLNLFRLIQEHSCCLQQYVLWWVVINVSQEYAGSIIPKWCHNPEYPYLNLHYFIQDNVNFCEILFQNLLKSDAIIRCASRTIKILILVLLFYSRTESRLSSQKQLALHFFMKRHSSTWQMFCEPYFKTAL